MNELGIEHLCVFGMPPVEFVTLAGELGCECVATGFEPMGGYVAHGYPHRSLRPSALAEAGVTRAIASPLRGRGALDAALSGGPGDAQPPPIFGIR